MRDIKMSKYHEPKLCDPVSSATNPGMIDNVNVYIKNKSNA
jgi:hypothetical protein